MLLSFGSFGGTVSFSVRALRGLCSEKSLGLEIINIWKENFENCENAQRKCEKKTNCCQLVLLELWGNVESPVELEIAQFEEILDPLPISSNY